MIIFVGDKPSSKMKRGAKPFEGAACEKRFTDWLCKIVPPTGVFWDENTWQSEWYTTQNRVPEYKIINQHNMTSLEFIIMSNNNTKWVAIGANASKALTKAGLDHFKLPHPSGSNRQVNNKEFIKQKLKECREWLNSK